MWHDLRCCAQESSDRFAYLGFLSYLNCSSCVAERWRGPFHACSFMGWFQFIVVDLKLPFYPPFLAGVKNRWMNIGLAGSERPLMLHLHLTTEWRARSDFMLADNCTVNCQVQTAGLVIPGIPKFPHVQTSCPYLVWETERQADISREVKWTGSKPVSTKQRANQTDWPTNYRNPLHHHPASRYIRINTPLLQSGTYKMFAIILRR